MNTGPEFKIGLFQCSIDSTLVHVELLGPKDPEGKVEQQTAYVGIELSKTIHRKLVRYVERLTRVAFEAKIKEMEARLDNDKN